MIMISQNKYHFQRDEKELNENMIFSKMALFNENEMLTHLTKYVDIIQHKKLQCKQKER